MYFNNSCGAGQAQDPKSNSKKDLRGWPQMSALSNFSLCVCWFFWKFSKLNESELKAIISVNVVGWNGVQYVCFCLI